MRSIREACSYLDALRGPWYLLVLVTKHLTLRLLSLSLALLPTFAGQSLAAQTAAASSDVSVEDVIRPGDVVRLTVLREGELSGEFPVNQFGTVVLPLVGEYDVTHESNRSLREKVIRDLQKIRSARDIELVVLRRVRVVGEVNEPGVYPLDPTMSVADAVALAKGRTQFADEGKVVLRRGGQVVDADLRLGVPLSESAILSGDEIFVPRRGWVDRNLGAVVAGASTLGGILITLLIR
jgi:polysaccharide export outer membrane protein